MADRKEYEMLFRLSAQLGSNYSSSWKKAQAEVASMQKELEALSKTQSNIAAYQKQQQALETTRNKLTLLKKEYDNIQKEMSETGTYSADLENKLLRKQQQIEKTTSSITSQEAKLRALDGALTEAGVDTSKLTDENKRLASEYDQLKTKQEEAADGAEGFGSEAVAAFGAVQQALIAAGITAALKQIYDGLADCAQASIEFESAMTGVSKTTDLSDSELAALSEEIKSLSTEIPVTTNELAEIGEVAGQLGIEKENLLDFTTVMSELSTATTMTADSAATLLAQFANITQMDPEYYSNLASAIVDLGNNYATTEQKITEMSQGIAASASLAGMSEADMVALSAAVTSLGIETEMGSTAMNKLISDLLTAVETGDKLEDFASIAGMSADEFAQAWGDDAVTALQSFVVGLSDTERNGKSATVALTDLGITETRMQRMILSLSNSGDLLNRTLTTANTAWDENTALTTEAEKRYATTQSQLILMQNAYNNLKIAVGDNYTPALQKLYAVAAKVLEGVTEFVQKHPALVKAVTVFVAIIGTAILALTAYAAIAKIAAVASALLTAAIPGVNIIMAVVAGVAALTAGIVALASATSEAESEADGLTATSKEQYYKLQELQAEYEEVCSTLGETSYEAQSLKWEIDDLSAEYESGKQTLEDYKAAHEELMQSYSEMSDSHTEAYEELDTESQSVTSLINKLEELAATTETATENKQAILAIIEALNEEVPELALSYDDVVSSAGNFAGSLREIAKAQADAAMMEEKWAEYVERAGKSESLKVDYESLQDQAAAAQQQFDDAKAAYDEAVSLYQYDTSGWGMYFGTKEEAEAYDEARENLEYYNTALDESTAAYEENEAALSDLEGEFQAFDEAQSSTEDLNEAISSVTERVTDLTDAYNEAYTAALDSIQGQYSLWDSAAQVVATSADTINSALESQITYWQDYNTNLSNLGDRSADIEGLGDMIASFADGSSDSVNAIAGMAQASDEDLAAMVQNWQSLQEEQKTTADSLADLETDFTASMDALQLELETTISEMNLNSEAVESGKNTIQGFIDGAENMLPSVQAAYASLGQAAIDALNDKLEIHSPSRVFELSGEMSGAGYIKGAQSMETETKQAMSDYAGAAADAFTADSMELVALAPQLLSYLYGAKGGGGGASSAEAYTVQSGGVTISVQYNIEAGATENPEKLRAVLEQNNESLRALIIETMADLEENRERTRKV